jgi:hypothetical protein
VTSREPVLAPGSSEENQADQEDDYDPGNRIRHNQAIPQLATGEVARFQWGSPPIGTSNRRRPRYSDPRYRRATGFRRFLPLSIRRFLRFPKCGGHENAWRAMKRLFAQKKYKMSFSFG